MKFQYFRPVIATGFVFALLSTLATANGKSIMQGSGAVIGNEEVTAFANLLNSRIVSL